MLYNSVNIKNLAMQQLIVKAKFHYAIWFEAGSKLVADGFEDGHGPASSC